MSYSAEKKITESISVTEVDAYKSWLNRVVVCNDKL